MAPWLRGADRGVVRPQVVRAGGEIGELAKSAGVKRLLLTHFRVHMDAPENMASALTALADAFGSNAAVAEDLDVYEI